MGGGGRAVPHMFTGVRLREGGADRHKNVESPVAWMQVPQVTSAPRQAAFKTTKVPRFDGTTSWEQYKQVFDAMVSSNGWDNDTAALQLFSHLEGDALNVALLVPLPRRLSRTDLVGVLSAHYGSPGRLADYRRQFEKTPPYLPRSWRH